MSEKEELNEKELDAVAGGREDNGMHTPNLDKIRVLVACVECGYEMIIDVYTDPTRIHCSRCKGKMKKVKTL